MIHELPASNRLIFIDQKVFAVGYAQGKHVPSTVSGNVLMISLSVFTTTCDVRTGFSGGPVFAVNTGQLLGITFGKSSVGTVNFALPSTEFVKIINEYNQSDGQL